MTFASRVKVFVYKKGRQVSQTMDGSCFKSYDLKYNQVFGVRMYTERGVASFNLIITRVARRRSRAQEWSLLRSDGSRY